MDVTYMIWKVIAYIKCWIYYKKKIVSSGSVLKILIWLKNKYDLTLIFIIKILLKVP